MKMLFLNPPTRDNKKFIREGRCMQLTSSWAAIWPPLSLATLAAIAKGLGHEVRIVDANVEDVTFEQIPSLSDGVDLVVVNTSFPSIDSDLAAAQVIKTSHPKTIVVSFGVFFTLVREASLPEDGSIDYALVGEPDATFRELLVALSNGSDPNAVPGLLFRRDGQLVFTGERALMTDLDELPLPERTLLHNERYVLPHNGEPFTLINTSRGCPFQCTYCIVHAYYGRKIRRHSLDYIFKEIEYCMKHFSLRNFLLWEEAFTLNPQVVKDFCQGLRERGLNINWAVTTRADSLEPELLRLMKDTGCFLVGMGIESSSQDILDRCKKQVTVEALARGVRYCNEVGLPAMGHFIFGLPGETPKTAKATIAFAKRLGLTYMQSYCAVPYPRTEFGELARKEGWVSTREWSRYDFGGDSIVNMPEMPAELVTSFRKKCFVRFYFRPSTILRELKKLGSWGHLRQALSFLGWIR